MKRFRLLFGASIVASASVVACGWSPSRPFEREAPEVREAIVELEAGKPKDATTILQQYLSTGACDQGRIGTPPRLRERPSGSFDLGLAFFSVAEAFGQRFGDDDGGSGGAGFGAGGGAASEHGGSARADTISCALQIVRAVAEDPNQPAELRARARYVEGNLLFLNGNYEDAVKAYEHALEIAPGMHNTGPSGASDSGKPYEPDAIGRDAAWNRAIALRRKDEKKPDAGQDGGGDGGNDGGDGGGNDGGNDGGGDGGNNNNGNDAGDHPDGGGNDDNDAGKPPPPPDQPDAGQPPPPPASQDERILDQLENAKTVQQEAAKKRPAHSRPVRGSADK